VALTLEQREKIKQQAIKDAQAGVSRLQKPSAASPSKANSPAPQPPAKK
jgi:hypothetical protein